MSLQKMGKKSILKLNLWLGKQYPGTFSFIEEKTVFMVLVQHKIFR